MTNFIDYDPHIIVGLSWYTIEVVDNVTGEPALGIFKKPPALKEASLCNHKVCLHSYICKCYLDVVSLLN